MKRYYVIEEFYWDIPKGKRRLLFKGSSKTIDDFFSEEGLFPNTNCLKSVLGENCENKLNAFAFHVISSNGAFFGINSYFFRKTKPDETPTYNFKNFRFCRADGTDIPFETFRAVSYNVVGIEREALPKFDSYEEAEREVKKALEEFSGYPNEKTKKEVVEEFTKKFLKYYPK